MFMIMQAELYENIRLPLSVDRLMRCLSVQSETGKTLGAALLRTTTPES